MFLWSVPVIGDVAFFVSSRSGANSLVSTQHEPDFNSQRSVCATAEQESDTPPNLPHSHTWLLERLVRSDSRSNTSHITLSI